MITIIAPLDKMSIKECLLRAAYGFDLEPIVMDGIKTKKLVENAEMDYVEMMFEMYAEPESSYGDITRHFTTQNSWNKPCMRKWLRKCGYRGGFRHAEGC